MAHYFFVKDFEEGRAAENFIMEMLRDEYVSKNVKATIAELPKDRQHEGDFEVFVEKPIDDHFTVEVKFDKMAGSTDNLCFEVANRKGDLTGIAATEASSVVYIVPDGDDAVTLYWFNSDELRDYLYDEKNLSKIRCVKGGDRKAYTLLLVSIKDIVKDRVAFSVERVNAELPV